MKSSLALTLISAGIATCAAMNRSALEEDASNLERYKEKITLANQMITYGEIGTIAGILGVFGSFYGQHRTAMREYRERPRQTSTMDLIARL